MDVKAEFSKYCGPDVQHAGDVRSGATLTIDYTIPPLDPDRRFCIVAHLRNGLPSVLLREVHKMADSARLHAYSATGQRDRDMRRLLKGRLA